MKKIFQNFKTSLFGSVAGLPLVAEGFQEKNYIKVLAGVGMVLVGLFAKDSDVNG